jgi:hypothetical protein
MREEVSLIIALLCSEIFAFASRFVFIHHYRKCQEDGPILLFGQKKTDIKDG